MMQAKGLSGSVSPLHTNSKYEHQIVQALKEKFHNYKAVLSEVLKWTTGQPSLTQQLCHMVVNATDRPTDNQEAIWVEKLVQHQWVSNWERRAELYPLREIRDRLMRRRKHNIQLLKQYHRIVHKGTIPDTHQLELEELKQLGLIISDDKAVRIANRLYSSIFDADWVESALKTIEFSLAPSDVEFRRLLVTLERNLLLSQVNILSQVDNNEDQRSSQALYEVLRDVTSKIGDLVGADRATIFLVNEDKTELWSLVAENDAGDFLDIQVRIGDGISGTVAATKRAIHIPKNVYDDPRAKLVKLYDEKYRYRTRNILALPVLNADKEVIAVIQFLNKLQSDESLTGSSGQSFTKLDVERLAKCILPIRRILESCQSCYKVMKKLRATAALAEATRSIDQINLDTKAILQRVMNTAKKLLNADRSTLWLVDQDRNELWTEIPGRGEVRCTIGVGFAGTVAETRQPMLIPFDLYNHPSADNAKKVDEQTHYRTCSLLCMPIVSPEGQLLGVTQLVNKRKAGYFAEYTRDDYPNVPDYFKTSFDKNDQQAMQVFNERVGVVLQFVRTHETLKQLSQAKPKEAIFNALAVLSNSVSEQADQSDDALYTGLYHMLTFISQAVGKLLGAEYTTIFLLDNEETGFWTLSEDEGGDATEIRVSATLGISARILKTKAVQVSREPQKFNDVLIYRGIRHSQIDRLHNLLLYPVLDHRGKVVAIIRCFNKLQSLTDVSRSGDGDDSDTFTRVDVEKLSQRTPKVLPILQAFQSFHQEILTIKENRRDVDPLYEAISFVKQSSGNPEELIQNVMQAVKTLTNADRSSLWLLNKDTNELWTKIKQGNGEWMEASVPMGVGFVGKVAKTGIPENIPFDLYDHPESDTARETDEKTRYRTCSLLCMPVLGENGELLGVTQLVNKREDGDYPEYDPSIWPEVPFHFRSSFEEEDQHNMEVFNDQVGVILGSMSLQ